MDPMNMIQNSAIKLTVLGYSVSDPDSIEGPIRINYPDLDSGRQKNFIRKKEKIIKYFEEPEHPLKLVKGTVSRDFLLLVFFMNQFPPSRFGFCSKIRGDIHSSRFATDTGGKWKNLQS
jgi:hypothetical protein